MAHRNLIHPEGLTAMKFGGVGCIGLLVDMTVLHFAIKAVHLSPFEGRAASLFCAMQATFLVNGLVVFRCVTRQNWARRWLAYMGANGIGNLCNYLIFAALVASRWPGVSRHGPALWIGSAAAYGVNYLSVRLLVFGRPRPRGRAVCDGPQPAGP